MIKQDIDIFIFTILGETVFEENIKNHFGDFKSIINLEKYGKSMYFLELKTKYNVVNKKLIIE